MWEVPVKSRCISAPHYVCSSRPATCATNLPHSETALFIKEQVRLGNRPRCPWRNDLADITSRKYPFETRPTYTPLHFANQAGAKLHPSTHVPLQPGTEAGTKVCPLANVLLQTRQPRGSSYIAQPILPTGQAEMQEIRGTFQVIDGLKAVPSNKFFVREPMSSMKANRLWARPSFRQDLRAGGLYEPHPGLRCRTFVRAGNAVPPSDGRSAPWRQWRSARGSARCPALPAS